jgi:putative membrane-bound dehydrogenase-like protein
MKTRTLALFTVMLLFGGCRRSGPPYGPKEALRTLKIEPGFRIEQYVTEPDIRSPVAMEFDEIGRLFVVEDPGYPLNVEGKVGRIILLEDTNGDGRPDRRTVFADHLTMPTGIMRWKKGVLVTDAPDVLYLEDSDGDGKADVRRVVLTGFAFSNPQHTVNNPVYGLDNWIYLAHEGPATAVIFTKEFGDRGSDLRFPDVPGGPTLKPARRMVRFRPDTHELEYLSSSTQFGHSFDEWGHHFTVSNEDHIREEVIAARYLSRNPDLPVGAAMERISDHRPAADVYPITQHGRVEMLSGVGSFTSACAITLYLGGALPSLGLFSLTAEPAQNLVHRDVLTPSGATYVARRAHERVEFLASADAWFRPVNFYIGPDAAIYVVDYYRMIIEHPEWMSTHTHHSPDLYKGEDRGRIYRIVPEAGLPMPAKIHAGQASDLELVEKLASPNIWWRRTAQRLLVDRQSAASVPSLVKMVETSQSAVARLHALWTLSGQHKLDPELIQKALDDPDAGVRENAILLVEPLLSSPGLLDKVLKLEQDPNSRVRFQLLSTLGGVSTPASRAAQERLLARGIEDPWMQIAALSASSERAPQFFEAARQFTTKKTDARATFFRQVTSVIGARKNAAEIRRVVETVADVPATGSSWWRAASLEGLTQGLGGGADRRGLKNENLGQELLLNLFETSDGEVRHAALRLLSVAGLPANPTPAMQRAAALAERSDADPALRADALGLLVLSDLASREPLFKQLTDAKQPEAVQAAAARALGTVKGAEVGGFLIAHWRAMTPAVRAEAADAMFLDPDRPRLLLAAIKDGVIQPWTLAFRHKRQLLMSRDPALRESARALLEERAGERETVLKRYEAALQMDGDPNRGRQVFERVCAKCHKLNGVGHEVGPDLATIRNRPPQLILPDILMPNKSIAQNYESYVIETRSGGIVEGVIGPQTANTITLRHEDGKQDVIQREDIKNIYMTNLSAMPDDLDKQISVDQMADLLKFLKTSQ